MPSCQQADAAHFYPTAICSCHYVAHDDVMYSNNCFYSSDSAASRHFPENNPDIASALDGKKR